MAKEKKPYELTRWEQGWTRMMVDIWRERLISLGVYDTGALYNSISGAITSRQITHEFLEYGIYVAAGVGKGYKHDNGGFLEFKDKDYRREHRLGKTRKPKDWFMRKYLYSLHRLNEKEAEAYGEQYQGMLTTALDELFGGGKLRSL